jgi:hypothetical protein
MISWRKCFELQDGQPTGRWQWVTEGAERAYYYPGLWLSPESFAPPPPIPGVTAPADVCSLAEVRT